MSQFGQQQFLYSAKPVTTINPSGIDPAQATAALGDVREGEQERALQAQAMQQQAQLAEQQMAQDQMQWEAEETRKQAEEARLRKIEEGRANMSRLMLEKLQARRSQAQETLTGYDDELGVLQDELAENEIAQSASSMLKGFYDIVTGTGDREGMQRAMDAINEQAAAKDSALRTFGGQLLTRMNTYLQSTALRDTGNLGLKEDTLGEKLGEASVKGFGSVARGVITDKVLGAFGVDHPVDTVNEQRDLENFVVGMAETAATAFSTSPENQPDIQAFFENAARIALSDTDDDTGYVAAMRAAYEKLMQAGVPQTHLAYGLNILSGLGTEKNREIIQTELGLEAENLLEHTFKEGVSENARQYFERLSGLELSWARAIGLDGAYVSPTQALQRDQTKVRRSIEKAVTAIASDPSFEVGQLGELLEALPEWGQDAFIEAMFDVREDLVQSLSQNPDALRLYKPHLERFLQASQEEQLSQIGDLVQLGRSEEGRLREEAISKRRRVGDIQQKVARAAASNVLSPDAIESVLGTAMDLGIEIDPDMIDDLLDLGL